jgi:hypothetical protein
MPRSSQISLRSLLLASFALGALIGIGGPVLTRAVRQWTSPPAAPVFVTVFSSTEWDSRNSGYFESAESPLR